jgi:DNA-binding transcriptional LysR family regulator
MLDWNDLRYFLGVARAGSTLAASKQMRVAQATVSRRVACLEEALGATLFARTAGGYALTQRGKALLPAAEAVEAAVASLTASVEAESRRLSGTVRITTVEGAANAWVIPALGAFKLVHPEVRADILVNERNLDLARGDADVAIRFGERPSEETLFCRHLVDLEETVYAARELVVRLGLPGRHDELRRYPLVGFSGDQPSPINEWYKRVCPDAEIAHRSNTVSGIMTAVRAGLGAAALPCLMGDSMRGLVRLFPPIPELATPGWLVVTETARQQPHVRALVDFLADYIRGSLTGDGPFAIARAA